VQSNIVAVATLKEHAGIILVNSCEPARDTLEKAIQEKNTNHGFQSACFELTGAIYNLLGKKD